MTEDFDSVLNMQTCEYQMKVCNTCECTKTYARDVLIQGVIHAWSKFTIITEYKRKEPPREKKNICSQDVVVAEKC